MSRLVSMLLAIALIAAACSSAASAEETALTVYSGRSEELVGPLIERFEDESGIEVSVRYGDSAELAATILEEGDRSPASVFLAQDPASLGSVALAGLFSPLGAELLDRVPDEFSDRDGLWVGVSGRARSVVYDPSTTSPGDLPPTEDGLTDEQWAGRVGIAPTNGSFLSFVAAKILIDGEASTLSWLEAMKANQSPTFPKNSTIVSAVADGQVETGLVNHYYALRLLAEDPAASVANAFFTEACAGSLVMPAGVGILASADAPTTAEAFVAYLLSVEAQEYFAQETFEYPLVPGVVPSGDLPPIDSIPTPAINLSDLAPMLDVATDLVAEAGLL
ncbi:MAG: iron ABC transporter substrate-binding protein [Acidimicrobiia bacterium]